MEDVILWVWLAGWAISFAIFWIGLIAVKNQVFHSDLLTSLIACCVWPIVVIILLKGK